jgi:hypothetical protein
VEGTGGDGLDGCALPLDVHSYVVGMSGVQAGFNVPSSCPLRLKKRNELLNLGIGTRNASSGLKGACTASCVQGSHTCQKCGYRPSPRSEPQFSAVTINHSDTENLRSSRRKCFRLFLDTQRRTNVIICTSFVGPPGLDAHKDT